VTDKGVCEGTKLTICQDGKLLTTDCAVQTGFICGLSAEQGKYQCMDKTTCQPSCTGKTCGSDDCGGSCGTCKAYEECQVNTCVPVTTEIVPDTAQPDVIEPQDVPPFEVPVQTDTTGPDGTCVPVCGDRVCGSDGCGGVCGTCKTGFACSTEGLCVGVAKPDTGAKEDTGGSSDVVGPSTDLGGSKGGGGGCSSTGTAAPFGLVILVLGVAGVLARRRRDSGI